MRITPAKNRKSKYIKMKKTFIASLLFFISIATFGQKQNPTIESEWSLVYSNDENGNAVAGDLRKLIDAVRNGETVRISWTIEHPTNKNIKVEHFADATFITILCDSTVFTQIDPIVGQTPSVRDKFITLKENVEWAFSASSTGNNDSMNMNKKTGDVIDHKPFKCGIKWFTRKKIRKD